MASTFLTPRRLDCYAATCTNCTNCTMVCPTCFCHGVEETPSLDFQQSDHTRGLGILLRTRSWLYSREKFPAHH